jgi:hypothetical protein
MSSADSITSVSLSFDFVRLLRTVREFLHDFRATKFTGSDFHREVAKWMKSVIANR